MTSILITGGAGFIGSHLCLELLQRCYDIYVIDSLANSSVKVIAKVNQLIKNNLYKSGTLVFKECDIRDSKKLEEIFNLARRNNSHISSVIHLAGLKSILDSYNRTSEYFDINVNGTKTLIEIMEKNNCFNLVFSSSATVYDQCSISPISEDALLNPKNPYGETKLNVEKILLNEFSQNKKWKIICLRYFNPIGSHISGEIGESPLTKPDNLFPYLCQVALGKIGFLSIFGSDWPTYDGTGVRDYIHIMDLVEGHIAALNYLRKVNSTFEIVNLGTGKGTSVLDLVKTFEEVNKISIKYKFVEKREGDIAIVFADVKYAEKILNWRSKFDLRDMCRHGWLFNKKYPNGL